jgi:hypothetical protein
MKIVITGPVAVLDEDDKEIRSVVTLRKLDGLAYDEDLCSRYLPETLGTIGITGGNIRLMFDAKAKRLHVITEYQSPRLLKEPELEALAKVTEGQWSDGIGSGCFDEYADKNEILIDLSPDSKDTVRVEQFDAEGKLVPAEKLTQTKPKDPPAATEKPGKSPLFKLASAGKADEIRQLLDAGENVNVVNREGMRPLFYAARAGQIEATRVLIERGALVDFYNKSGGSPMFVAIQFGHLEIVRLLLDGGSDMNAPTVINDQREKRISPLMMACSSSKYDIARLLVERGADVNQQTSLGRTPLMALGETQRDLAKVLIDRGADVNARSASGAEVREVLRKLRRK